MIQDRHLTTEEIANIRRVRDRVVKDELPDIIAGHQERMNGMLSKELKLKGLVKVSRHTDCENAVDVGLQIGDVFVYRLLDGNTCLGKIRTKLMRHSSGAFGYESSLVHFPGEVSFSDEKRIVWWDGKPGPKPEITIHQRNPDQLDFASGN